MTPPRALLRIFLLIASALICFSIASGKDQLKMLAISTLRRVLSATCVMLCLTSCGGSGYMSVLAQAPGGRGAEKVITRPRANSRRPKGRPVVKQRSTSTISLWIVSKPPNCKVSINGDPRGETDANGELEVRLPPGTHTIRLSREGYLTREAEVEVVPTTEEQEVEFTLPSAVTSLNVVTDPPGAEVYLDDLYRGTSGPNGLLVLDRVNPSQPHTLRARKDGYVQQSTPVTTYTGQISIKLLPDSMRLKVMTDPPEAEVYLDDVYKGTSTSNGTLEIDQVNPNQPHTVRAKKEGYRQESSQVPPNSSQALIKLSPDPIVLLVKNIRQLVAQDHLVEAYNGYEQLTADAPDHQELPRLSESILQNLQVRSADMLKRVEPFGLAVAMKDSLEMSNLYRQARKWRPGDEMIGNLGKFWDLRLALLQADRTASASEKEGLRRSARSALTELSEHNLRNPYLLLDLGWSWWKLSDKPAAQKQFRTAQELKPDWAYPHFALGVLAMNTAENERGNSAKKIAYGQAIDSFTKAISLKHDFATAYALQSISYTLLKKYEESVASGLQAIAVDPQSAYAHFALGLAYFQKGKSGYRNARDQFDRALSLGGTELDDATKSAIQQRLAQIGKAIK